MISFNTKKLFKLMLFVAFFSAIAVKAQSTNSDFPTPVTTNEIKGRIAARDIGDARFTRYFYTFTGTPGDLNITIESENLNGDIDVFTLNGLRPLAKISLFDYGFKIVTTGNVYLRKRETLVLRVEAKSKGENAGTFRIQFSGGFEAIAADAEEKQTEEPKIAKTNRSEGTFRVNSAGARLEEPKPPVKEKPAPKTETASTSTSNTGTAKTKPAVIPKTTTPKPDTSSTTKKTTTETATNTTTTKRETPAARRKRLAEERAEAERKRREEAAAERKRKQEEDKAVAEERKNNSVAKAEANKANKKTEATNNTSAKPAANAKAKEPAPDPMASISLVVETKDGGRIERRMNEVRRVNVEKGFLVVVFMDGKTERIPMTNVLKMSIEPQ